MAADAPAATGGAEPVGVAVEGACKRFGRFAALDAVSLEVRPGELLSLLGPSGSGKTTLLRVLAGLEFPDSGRVLFDGEEVTYASAAARRVGFVFQQYALFRHMSVAGNIAFGLDVRPRRLRPSRAERARRVERLLALMGLEGLGGRRPAQLSGGQRQRVALARALAVEPRVLLLDEPFGALDATVRKSLRRELRRVHDETGVTTVFVTHDQTEALELSDRVAVMDRGRLQQAGTPTEILSSPANAFVAGFVGEANRVGGEVLGGVFHRGEVRLAAPDVADGPAVAFVPPADLVLAAAGEPALDARLERAPVSAGARRLECRGPAGELWEALAAAGAPAAPGSAVRLAVRGGCVFTDAG